MVVSYRFPRSPDDCQEFETFLQPYCFGLAYTCGVACRSCFGWLRGTAIDPISMERHAGSCSVVRFSRGALNR